MYVYNACLNATVCNHDVSMQKSHSNRDEINHHKRASYLKTEISQSQEWFGKAMITQTAADNHAAQTIPMEIFETFWVPRCKKHQQIKFENWLYKEVDSTKNLNKTRKFDWSEKNKPLTS